MVTEAGLEKCLEEIKLKTLCLYGRQSNWRLVQVC